MRVGELLEHTELTLEHIGLLCIPVAPLGSLSVDDSLVPCSRVWPMGYSWSSAVAQDVSLGLLRCEGFDEEQVICVEEPPPCNQSDCVFVLTDDCIMAHVARAKDNPGGFSKQQAAARVQQLDHAMQANGVQRKIEKDVTCADALTGMGCSLTGDPPRAEPDVGSVKRAIFGIWGLDGVESATPGVLASLVGVCQWFALLNRPFFSIFDKVFAFARREPQDVATLLPVGTKAELSLFTALVPLLVAELARDYAPIIAASDAAPEFGFGVSLASADDRTLRDLGRLAERRGEFRAQSSSPQSSSPQS